MSSLLTNQSAITALQNLTATNKSLQMTQTRISTGLRVQTAADNAAYWSISTTMKSDNEALSTVKDALALGSAKIDVASAALTTVKDVVSGIKAKLVAAQEPGVDRSKVQKELTAMQEQLKSISDSAVFSGQNWLSVDSGDAGYNATKSVVASFTRDTTGAISISKINIDISGTELFDADDQSGILDKDRTSGGSTVSIMNIDISALTDSAADMTTLGEFTAIVDAGLDDIINAASDLGAAKNRVTVQQGFIGKLSDSITTGVGALVDADMNEESTRLQALQTQQSLGVQSLSIANQSSQSILQLFR
jgi:flagellin